MNHTGLFIQILPNKDKLTNSSAMSLGPKHGRSTLLLIFPTVSPQWYKNEAGS